MNWTLFYDYVQRAHVHRTLHRAPAGGHGARRLATGRLRNTCRCASHHTHPLRVSPGTPSQYAPPPCNSHQYIADRLLPASMTHACVTILSTQIVSRGSKWTLTSLNAWCSGLGCRLRRLGIWCLSIGRFGRLGFGIRCPRALHEGDLHRRHLSVVQPHNHTTLALYRAGELHRVRAIVVVDDGAW